jgi:hypothetical protein
VNPATDRSRIVATAWLAAGLLLLAAGWLLPVNLTSISPALLHAAGAGTQTLGAFGRDLVDFEKPGPAALVQATAQKVSDPRAPAVARALEEFRAQQPEAAAWGGWDPFLDATFNLRAMKDRAASTPVLEFFLPEDARGRLRAYLANSRSPSVQEILKTRGVAATGRFEPATRPGGQPLEAVILLTALLGQADRLAPPLLRELRDLAAAAADRNELGDLEPVFLDLLSLAQRLDWTQLSELLKRANDTRTVNEYAHLARVAPDELPLIYSAALFSDSADRVATYLLQYGKLGVADLTLALGSGQGALRLLLSRQAPVSRQPSPDIGAVATFGYLHPRLALALKWLGFLAGAFGLLRGLDRLLFAPLPGLPAGLPRMQGGLVALLLAGLLVLMTEPYLLKAVPPSEFRLRLVQPVIVAAADAPSLPANTTPTSMDTSTLLSIALFAGLQVAMYFVCLMKIREIERSAHPTSVKLRLMENEENLFDGGLYLGIAGTATALILQVLHVIEYNLLAAYSSNLFGIACVALVKIRHVRPYKCGLILRGAGETKAAS